MCAFIQVTDTNFANARKCVRYALIADALVDARKHIILSRKRCGTGEVGGHEHGLNAYFEQCGDSWRDHKSSLVDSATLDEGGSRDFRQQINRQPSQCICQLGSPMLKLFGNAVVLIRSSLPSHRSQVIMCSSIERRPNQSVKQVSHHYPLSTPHAPHTVYSTLAPHTTHHVASSTPRLNETLPIYCKITI